MALVAYAGTSGRVSLVNVTPVLTADAVTYTGTPDPQVSLSKWSARCGRVGEIPKALTFESPADTQGELAPVIHRGGAKEWVVMCEGLFDQAESSDLQTSPFIVADLIVKKDSSGSQEGFGDVPGKIENFQIGTGVGQGMATCSFEIHVSGHLPAFATNN